MHQKLDAECHENKSWHNRSPAPWVSPQGTYHGCLSGRSWVNHGNSFSRCTQCVLSSVSCQALLLESPSWREKRYRDSLLRIEEVSPLEEVGLNLKPGVSADCVSAAFAKVFCCKLACFIGSRNINRVLLPFYPFSKQPAGMLCYS